jgi:hypothetical protein
LLAQLEVFGHSGYRAPVGPVAQECYCDTMYPYCDTV